MEDLKGQRIVLTNNLAKHVGDSIEPCGYWKLRLENSPVDCITPDLKMQRVVGFSTSCEHCAREQSNSGDSCDNPRVSSPRTEDTIVENFEEDDAYMYIEDGVQKSPSDSVKGTPPSMAQDLHDDLFSPFSNDTSICDMTTEHGNACLHKMCSFGHPSMHAYKSSMERTPSRLTKELLEKTAFETRMSRLKNLNIAGSKIEDIDQTPVHMDDNGELVRTLSCRAPGELVRCRNGYTWAKKKSKSATSEKTPCAMEGIQVGEVSPGGSSCSEAMPIPRMSRARTTPDPLPEISASMLDSIMKSKESPKAPSEMKHKTQERKRSPKGVPSAEFLQNIAALKDLQDHVFENPDHHHIVGDNENQKHGLSRRYSSRFRDI